MSRRRVLTIAAAAGLLAAVWYAGSADVPVGAPDFAAPVEIPETVHHPEIQQAFIPTLILWAVFFVLSELLKPRPRLENARPAGLGDFELPTAMEGRPVPLVWGTVKQSGPNVIWYGDLFQEPITERVKVSLFSSKRFIKGFKYHLGIQFALCRGGTTPVGSLRRIWIGEDLVWEGNLTTDGESVTIDEPELFGGNDLGGGGVVGPIRFFSGSLTQEASAYLTTFQTIEDGDPPAYVGTSYVTFEHGYIGNSIQIAPWAFELRRIPNGLGLSAPAVNNGNDANPMNVLYEILTDTEWGMGRPPASIDTANFVAAATVLAAENNGFSMILDRTIPAEELVREVERQIDGVMFQNRTTGRWQVRLARADFDPEELEHLTPANVVQIRSFTRGSWADTTNVVLNKFHSRSLDYNETYAGAQDMANIRINAGRTISAEQQYPGVKSPGLANDIAWRDLRLQSRPLGRIEMIVDRSLYDHNPGDVFRFSDPSLGLSGVVFRIIRIDLGRLTQGEILVTAVEDVFSQDSGQFTPPANTLWTPTGQEVVPIPGSESLVIEAPRAFVDRDPENPGLPDRLWVGGRHQGDGAVEIDVVAREGGANFEDVGDVSQFLLAGSLAADIGVDGTQGSITVAVDAGPNSPAAMLAALQTSATEAEVGGSLVNVVLVNGEFFGFRAAAVTGNQLVLSQGFRGLLDGGLAPHKAGDRVWLLRGNLTDQAFDPTATLDVRLLPRSRRFQVELVDAPNIDVTLDNRYRRPYAPANLKLNGDPYPDPASLDAVGGGPGPSLDGLGVLAEFTRRDWRTGNEAASVVDENSLPGDFPGANNTQYRASVWDDPEAAPLFSTAWNNGSAAVPIGRTRILRFTGAVPPEALYVEVETRHVHDAVAFTSLGVLPWGFGTASNLVGQFVFGVLATNAASAVFTLPITSGTLNFEIGAALSTGSVQARVNNTGVMDGGAPGTTFTDEADGGVPGTTAFDAQATGGFPQTLFGTGVWETVIAAGNTFGDFEFAEDDSVQIRHTQAGSTDSETFLQARLSAADVAYAVLTF